MREAWGTAIVLMLLAAVSVLVSYMLSERHGLLGVDIAYGAVAFLFGVGCLGLGFYGTCNALHQAFNGRKVLWLWAGCWLGCSFLGLGLASYVPIYWLSKCTAC